MISQELTRWLATTNGSSAEAIGQAGAEGGVPGVVIWVGLIALLAVIFLLVRGFGPRRVERDDKPAALPEPEKKDERPADELVDDRQPSLKEIKKSRAEKLAPDLQSREAILEARQARKGKTRAKPDVQAEESPEPAQEVEPTVLLVEPTVAPVEPELAEPVVEEVVQKTLKEGLEKTRTSGFVGRIKGLFSKKRTFDHDLMTDLEEVLFTADIGVKTSQYLLETVEQKMADDQCEVEKVWELLRDETTRILLNNQKSLTIGEERPFVILVIGVNGVGKTTTIGKLAARYVAQGLKVLLVAGDTFRAAAVDQLKIWGERSSCDVFSGADKADPSAVVFDSLKKAEGDGVDIVLVDTAGRLHTKVNLVEELKKVRRVCEKAIPGTPHRTLLVLDANTGQNAISQADMFAKEVGITGIVLTKLDGTAKGGVVIGISDELQVPVQFIGIGEQVEDLREFQAQEFVEALY